MEYHLTDLRKALENKHWTISGILEGDDYKTSGIWLLERFGEKIEIHFNGLDDLECLPIEKAYGCDVITYPKVGLHFAPKNKSWKKLLQVFISEIEAQSTTGS